MDKQIGILISKCSAFRKMHGIIRHEEKENSFFCHTHIFGVLYNFLNDDEIARKIMHEYLQEYHPDYDKETTDYQISKITDKKLKPICCKTLQKGGYCKGLCSNIGKAKSPISLLYKAQCVPLITIEQDTRSILQFAKKHKLSGSEGLVIICLISYKNALNNVVYPSVETVALDTGLSEKTVKNATKRLVTKKLITKALQRQKGRYPFNKYELSQELLDGYKPKVGEHISKNKLGVKVTPISKPNTGEGFIDEG